ncbi:MAG: beta-lactamase family protein [Acidobacteria bacterium]|nr:beta-lactamase family protein [Acidobacteriota bacterium]
MRFAEAEGLIAEAIASRASPAVTLEVGRTEDVLWQHAAGCLTYAPDAPPAKLTTPFDLASLTKVIATTSLVMRAVARGTLAIDTPLSALLAEWRAADRQAVTLRHLLDHSSGLPGHVRLWEHTRGRDGYTHALATLPLERPPGTAAVYSDPGFMLLGFAVERRDGRPLDAQAGDIAAVCGASFSFGVSEDVRARTAPTEDDRWRGRLLQGEVHDENAAALGGVAGHAGLFGTAADVGAFARLVLETFRQPTPLGSPLLMREFIRPSAVPGSSRALGWDTMRPTSSCGRLLSPSAIGHTGFTGTSLWIDPARDLYVALLANRVHPSRTNEAWLAWRPRIHDAIAAALERRDR